MIDLPQNGILLYESKHGDGDVVREHRHVIHQILYVLDGRGSIAINGRKAELGPDTFVLLVPNTDHAIVSSEKLTLLVLAFNAGMLDRLFQEQLLNSRLSVSSVFHIHPFTASDIRQLLRKMIFEQGGRDLLGQWAVRIYLQEALLLFSRSQRQQPVQDAGGVRAERIRRHIDENYYGPITNGELSAKMNMSARHVNNIFKESYGTTPFQYLTEVRISVAQKLLAETDKDIATICFEVGYENVPTFYRAFRNIVKLSPNKFRQHKRLE